MNKANVVSLTRGLLLAPLLFLLYKAGANSAVLVVCAIFMWATDFVDGRLARRSNPTRNGPILDPAMDDIALFIGFAILLDMSAIPLWFFVLLAISRVLFVLVRTIGLQQTGLFSASQPVTKQSGAVLAIGQCILLADQATVLKNGVGGAMAAMLIFSVNDFVIRRHGKMLVSLVKSET